MRRISRSWVGIAVTKGERTPTRFVASLYFLTVFLPLWFNQALILASTGEQECRTLRWNVLSVGLRALSWQSRFVSFQTALPRFGWAFCGTLALTAPLFTPISHPSWAPASSSISLCTGRLLTRGSPAKASSFVWKDPSRAARPESPCRSRGWIWQRKDGSTAHIPVET